MKTTPLHVLLFTSFTMILSSGCGAQHTLLMDKSQFEATADITFPSVGFRRVVTDNSFVENEKEFSQDLEPLDPVKPISLDLSEFGTFLRSKETFDGSGSGGRPALHSHLTLSNSQRFVSVDCCWLKNGNIRLVYREVLR